MSDRNAKPTANDLVPLIEALVNDTIDDAGFARLDAMLGDSAHARRIYRRYINLHAALPGMVGHEPEVSLRLPNDPVGQIADTRRLPDDQFIDLLQQIDASADDSGILSVTEILAQQKRTQPALAQAAKSDRPSASDVVNTLGYLAGRALIAKPAVAAGIAAVLLLAVSLLFVFSGGENPTLEIAQPDALPTPALRPVATLTGQRDATWASASGPVDRSVGDALSQGQRLTLTAGFAEITTARGAVAILEAPCTVELLDSPNALRLVGGKLVGIVETDQAKGFFVRTSHMEVTDLGTRFGVAIDESSRALVEVFKGRVRVDPISQASDTFNGRQLSQGQVVAVSAAGREIKHERNSSDTFARLLATQDGVASLSGDVSWATSQTRLIDADAWPRDTSARIYEELSGYRLAEDVPLTFHGPGIYDEFKNVVAQGVVSRGTTIRSYVIIFNPDPSSGDTSCRGSVTFDGEVLGISAMRGDWNQFVSATRDQRGSVYRFIDGKIPTPEGSRAGPLRDELVLEEDGLTVAFMFSSMDSPEVIRVIVREPARGFVAP